MERLEREIDNLNADLAPLTSFVLPGGTPAAAYLHLARTMCRRAERIMVELAARPAEPVTDAAMHYINRLSDFLFVASRAANNNGARDVLWVPGRESLSGRSLDDFQGRLLAPRALTGVGRTFRFRAKPTKP